MTRFWLWLNCYCWPHTILYCADCRHKRQAKAEAKRRAAIRRMDEAAYKIRRSDIER